MNKLKADPNQVRTEKDLADYINQVFLSAIPKADQLLSFGISLKFMDLVPNHNAAPYGKQKNWAGISNLPIGYPGWLGYITVEVTHPLPKRVPSYFVGTNINVTNVQNFQTWNQEDLVQVWNVSVFLDDWKELELSSWLANTELGDIHEFYYSNRKDSLAR